MERICGTGVSENGTFAEAIHISKCSLDLTQLFLNLVFVNIIAIVYASQRCFWKRRKKVVKGQLFSHHNWTWNLTFVLFLFTSALCAEGWIVLLSSPNLPNLGKMFKTLIFSSEDNNNNNYNNSNISSIFLNSSDVTSDMLSNFSNDNDNSDSFSAYLLLFMLTPTSLLFVVVLVSCLYHKCESKNEPKFLWINIIFFLSTSVLSFAKLYLHFMDGLTLLHVQVFANIFSAFATGILASILIHTIYNQKKKQSSAGFYPVGEVDLTNVKYLHFYSPLLSRITFFWLNSLLRQGYKEPLEEEDLGQLPPEEKTAYQFDRFHKNFLEEKEKASTEARHINLWKCMSKTMWPTLMAGGFCRLAADFSGFVAPLGIKTIVNYASRNTSELGPDFEKSGPDEFGVDYLTISQIFENGYVMAFIILLSALLQSTFSQCSTFLVNSEGIHIKVALQTLIYKKSLTLCTTKSSQNDQSSSASSDISGDENEERNGDRKSPHKDKDNDRDRDGGDSETSDGQSNSSPGFDKGSISNLMSEDTNNIMMFFWNIHFIWAIPLKLAILMVLLYLQLGYSALIGATVCVSIMIPLQYLIIAKYMSSNSAELMERCDDRLRAISEILQGIKLLKLQGWELIFSQRAFAIREKELRNLDKDMLYRSLMTFLTHISMVVVTLVTFGLYSYIEDEKLVPSKVFAGIALFNQLLVPLFVFPMIAPIVIDALVSVKRLREFLLLPEVTPLQLTDLSSENTKESDKQDQVDTGGKTKSKKKKKKEVEEEQQEGEGGKEASLKLPKGDKIRDLNASSDSVFHQSLENIVEDEEIDDDDDDDDDEDEEDGDNSIVFNKASESTDGRTVAPTNEQNIKNTSASTTIPPVTHTDTGEKTDIVVSIRNGDFSWDAERHDDGLTGISLKIPREKLTVIVGITGSGKSSLIFALLGEMRRITGDVRWARGTSIAYVGQKPWILGCSVRDNITFGNKYKPRRYMKVVEACALQEDINILPEKDATDLGGINLSGGQRQRLAIARAIYSDANVVILDDPLSALDVDVAHHVFDTGIRKFLLKSKRTVILVTHHLPVLHHAHHIISMEKGRIRIQGALESIKVQDPKLYKIWTEIMTKKEAEIIKQQEAKTAKERWSLLKLVSKIGLQFKHRNSDAGAWKPNDEAKSPLDPYRKRKGTFSHYKNLSYDIFSPGDEHHDELMTPLLRRRCVSRISRESRTSSSSIKHPELMRMTSLQNDSTTGRTKSPVAVKKFQRLQSLPVTDEVQPPSSPPMFRGRSGTDSGKGLKETMFKKMFHTKRTTSVGSSQNSDLEKNLDTSGRLSSTVSGISEGEEDDEEVEESLLVQQSHEEREYGTIPLKVYLSYIAACGNVLSLFYLFFSIGYEVIRVYTTFWLSNWSDEVSRATDDNYDDIMSYHFNIYTILSLITVIVSLTCNLVGKEAGANSRELFHARMLDRIVRCPMRFYDTNPPGRIITRFSSDMAFIDRKLCIAMQRFLQFVFMCVSAIVVNAIVNPWILLGAFPVIAIYFYIQRFYRYSSRELQRLEAISRGPIYNHFHETLEGLSTIRAYREQTRFTNQMLEKIEANNRAAVFINVGNRWLSSSLDYLGSIMVFLATLASMISSYLYPDLITPSMVGLAINYILLVPVYLNQVVKFLAEVEMFMNSVERVNRYSELEIENYDESNESWPVLPEKWPTEGQLEFDNISVQYGPDRPPIISDLKARIGPKQKVGICGRSGSGKSTLLMALFRITELSKGRILIDGVDIHKIPLLKLRSSLSIIPQENILFSGTIRFNLDPEKKATDADIWRALELCQIKETIKEMPGQLDTDMKDGGTRFSAGQKQLLGLARAILHKSKLVIMDEATSNVDLGTERTLLEVVKDEFKDSTTLSIAHRLEAIVDGDRVLVLDQGKIAEDGHPAQLRKKRLSIFASMLRNADEHNNVGK